MKVFVLGDRKNKTTREMNLVIAQNIKALGHAVDKSQIESTPERDSQNFEEAYKRNTFSIKNCDLLVVEVTELSSGLGFMIARALSERKPVLALYNSELVSQPSITLRGAKDKAFALKEYTPATLKNVLSDYFIKVKDLIDTKFILIISPEIDKYLEWASSEKRMHKAQIVRDAIEIMMNKDKTYKEFMKNVS